MNLKIHPPTVLSLFISLLFLTIPFLILHPGPALDGSAIRDFALEQVGKPYQYGGQTPDGFDCSGLTIYVYNHFGIQLPRTTSAQYGSSSPVEKPEVGDLVFFDPEGNGVSHVGIYTGNGEFVHAPSSGKVVRVSRLDSAYWSSRFVGARRWDR